MTSRRRIESSSKRFQVFEFNDEEEQVDKEAKSKVRKYSNPKSDYSPVNRYRFLECFAKGANIKQMGITNEILNVDTDDDTVKEVISESDATASNVSSNCESTTHPNFLDHGLSISGPNYQAAIVPSLGLSSTVSKPSYSSQPQFFSDVSNSISLYVPGESFEEVIYPKGDPDAVSISKRDIEILEPEKFINDTIVDFYIKYLENKIKPEEKHRYHFFNSFFFRKLADLDKTPPSACEGRDSFKRVSKWTRKVNIFEKDYIFIPVNFSFHWSLIVICHPGNVANIKDADKDKMSKVPCILHMDSLKGSHRGLKKLIRSYLWEEWKERQNQSSEDVSSTFLNLLFVPLEVPQQENCFDCGLFLLHYVELFLDHAPVDLSPFKNAVFSNFLNEHWFPPAEASHKRAHIKKLIYDIIVGDNSEKAATARPDKYPYSELASLDVRDTGEEFLLEICNSPKIYYAHDSIQQIEIMPLVTSPLRSMKCTKERQFIMAQSLEPKADGDLPFDDSVRQMISSDRSKNEISAIEEGEEMWEQQVEAAESMTTAKKYRTPVMPSYSVLPVQEREYYSRTSVTGSPTPSEAGINEDCLSDDMSTSNPTIGDAENSECPLTLLDRLEACVVEDSEEEDGIVDMCVVEDSEEEDGTVDMCVVEDSEEERDGTVDIDENERSLFHLGRILSSSSNQNTSSARNIIHGNNIPPMSLSLE
ncbi:Ulp1 peptidase [Bertholletia excelsa]